MTPAELGVALESLGWSERELARRLSCIHTLPGKWREGRSRVPPPIAAWLRRRVADLEGDPPPEWRTRSAA